MATEFDKLVAEAAESLKREAYLAGWRDCLTALGKAVAAMGDPQTPESIDLHGEVEPNRSAPASGAVTPGSTPYYVLQAIRKTQGMTGAQIVVAVQEGGHKVTEGAIRTTISRLKDRKLIVSRHAKWFPL